MTSPPNFLSFADLKLNSNTTRIGSPIQSPFLSPFPSSPSSPSVEPRRTKSRHMDAFSFFDAKAPPAQPSLHAASASGAATPLAGQNGMHAPAPAPPGPARSMTPLQSPYALDKGARSMQTGGTTSRWEAPGSGVHPSQHYASQQQQQQAAFPTLYSQQYAPQQLHQTGLQHGLPLQHQSMQPQQAYAQHGYAAYGQQPIHHASAGMHTLAGGYRATAPTAMAGAGRPLAIRSWSHAATDPYSRDPTPLASPAPVTPGIGTVIGDDGDEVISTAVVVKNIPFSLKKETLLDLFDQLTLPKPYAFNYHFDNGTFRGLAFANFHSPEETQHVIGALNGYELIGRKLRVEYKKVLPADQRERIELQKRQRALQEEAMLSGGLLQRPSSATSFVSLKTTTDPMQQHGHPQLQQQQQAMQAPKPEMDLNDPATLQIYSSLLLFRDDASPDAQRQMAFPPEFSPIQRRTVHLVAQKLGLAHTSRGEDEERYVVVSKQTQEARAAAQEAAQQAAAGSSQQQQHGQRPVQSQSYAAYPPLGPPSQQQQQQQQQQQPAPLRIDTKPDLKPRTSYGQNLPTLAHLQPPGLKQMKSYSDLRQPSPLRTTSAAALSPEILGGGSREASPGLSQPSSSPQQQQQQQQGYYQHQQSMHSARVASPMGVEGRMEAMSLGNGPASAPVRQPKGPEPQRAFLGRTASLRGGQGLSPP